jgi:hypothetical protein
LTSSSFAVSAKKYSDKELLQKIDASKASLEQYSLQVQNIFKKNSIESRNEGVIVKESLEKEDPSILKELGPIIASYKAIIQGLVSIPAPEPVYYLHKDLINSISTIVFVDESFEKVNIDPILSLQGLARIQDASKILFESVKGITDYMAGAGITFNLK